jgi:dihydropteroate synthase
MATWQVRDRAIELGNRALVMGIVNVTPDSFSDGDQFLDKDAAIAHALELHRQGADILDIGGESTRPGADSVPLDEELRRVLPVIEALTGQVNVPLSVDTSKPAVARACLTAGAHIVNDVTGLSDPDMQATVRDAGAGAIVMHMQGTPATMQLDPCYGDVVDDILQFFEERIALLTAQGLRREALVIDPGLGFGKRFQHSLQIMARLAEFQRLGLPVCLGASRKGFIGKIIGRGVDQSLSGSLAMVSAALSQKAAQIVRVHDVAATRDTVLIWDTIHQCRPHAPRENRPQPL